MKTLACKKPQHFRYFVHLRKKYKVSSSSSVAKQYIQKSDMVLKLTTSEDVLFHWCIATAAFDVESSHVPHKGLGNEARVVCALPGLFKQFFTIARTRETLWPPSWPLCIVVYSCLYRHARRDNG